LKLYYSTNLNPRVAVAVARHLKSPVEFVRASPRDPRCEEAFCPINPNTLAPVLAEGDRSYWETDAIACVDPSRRTGRRRRSQIPPIRSLPFVRFTPNSAPNRKWQAVGSCLFGRSTDHAGSLSPIPGAKRSRPAWRMTRPGAKLGAKKVAQKRR
jgi:hypothetical protein